MFADRAEAGRRLAARLAPLVTDEAVVLALPRGGVPVAAQVASALRVPLDVIVVRKLGVPHQPELGMGAIGEDGVRVVNAEIVHATRVTERQLNEVERRERAELERRARTYREDRPRVPLEGRVAVIVDDGIATGSTAKAACEIARAHGARRVVLAVPVAPPGWDERMGAAADLYVAVETPEPFGAIGYFYDDFDQVSDDEVVRSLARLATSSGIDSDVTFRADGVTLGGHLTLPPAAKGLVVFAHGSGSSRWSTRNQYVARLLDEHGLGTFLFDLLSEDEVRDRANVFNIGLLAARLGAATRWVRSHPVAGGLPLGYFGASTGAAAALWAASDPSQQIDAVVSRGGRPDLAEARLADVTAPTLLVVGGQDEAVLALNREAAAHLQCEHRLEVVPGATHLFEEPGTLQAAAFAAAGWFERHLGSKAQA